MKNLDPNSEKFKNYEKETETTLEPEKPIIVRLDGKAFHTFTKQSWCESPFSDILVGLFEDTMKYLCENVQGCRLGYHQSDEITLVLTKNSVDSESFLGGRLQKIVSVVASMATMRFNTLYYERVPSDLRRLPAVFDTRVFQVPNIEEAVACVKWRADDAAKNSKHMFARTMFSHRQLQGKSGRELVEMMAQQGFDYAQAPVRYRCGSLCVQRLVPVRVPAEYAKNGRQTVERKKWFVVGYDYGTLASALSG